MQYIGPLAKWCQLKIDWLKTSQPKKYTATAILLCVFTCLLPSPCFSNESKQQNLENLNLENRTVQGILWIFQKEHLNIVYSDELIQPRMIQTFNPPTGDPIERLKIVLSAFNLSLNYEEFAKTWFVVPSIKPYQYLRFSVIDAKTLQPITGVVAHGRGRKIGKSDQKGIFNLRDNPPNAPISFSHPDYSTKKMSPEYLFNNKTIELSLLERNVEEVLVTASQYKLLNNSQISVRRIQGYEAEMLPSHGNDAIRVINAIPGAASSGVSAKPNIRGGAQDELLILFDDIELSNPFHLKDFYSLISAINSYTVSTVDIYTGGYPANYGSKMSGVMDIKPINPVDMTNSFDWNFYTTALNLAGTSEQNNLNGMLTLRRGNIDDLLTTINEDIGAPRFSDAYAKVHWQPSSNTSLSAGLLSLMDDVKLTRFNDDKLVELARSEYVSNYLWVKADLTTHTGGSQQWIFATSDIKNRRRGNIEEPENAAKSVGTLIDRRDIQTLRVGYSQAHDFNHAHSIKWGGLIEYATADYDYHAEATLGELALLLGQPQHIDNTLTLEMEGIEAHAHFTHNYSPLKPLKIETGIRLDKQHYFSKSRDQLSPRFALRYELTSNIAIKFSAGRFYQTPDIDELHIGSSQPLLYKPQKSDHYIVGIDYQHKNGMYVSLESYKKNVFSPKARWENIMNPYSLLPELSADRVEVIPDTARATGLEIVFGFQANNNLSTQVSYTRSHAEDKIQKQNVYRAWDQAHTLQGRLVLTSNRWTLAAMANWHSGWRTSRIPDTTNSLVAPLDWSLNASKLPNFLSFDIRASCIWPTNQGDVELYLEINNLLNRVNEGYYDLTISPQSSGIGYNLDLEPQQLLPALPSLGIRWEF